MALNIVAYNFEVYLIRIIGSTWRTPNDSPPQPEKVFGVHGHYACFNESYEVLFHGYENVRDLARVYTGSPFIQWYHYRCSPLNVEQLDPRQPPLPLMVSHLNGL